MSPQKAIFQNNLSVLFCVRAVREMYIEFFFPKHSAISMVRNNFYFHLPPWSFIQVRILSTEISADLKNYSFSLHRMKQITTFFYIT